MRSGSLLLFTLIASSILAVFPMPMDQGLVVAGPSGSSSAPAIPVPIVTFLDRRTGEISITGKKASTQLETRLTVTIFIEGFGMPPGLTPVYKGSYGPSPPEKQSRQWVYIIITGIPDCPVHNPCYGWIAMGAQKALSKSTHPAAPLTRNLNTYGKKYVGVSLAWNNFRGKPAIDPANAIITAARQGEWDIMLVEYKRNLKISVTFIGIDGRPLTGVGQHHVPESDLTRAINGALRRGPEDPITFHGRYDPVGGNRQWVYFQIVITFSHCTTASPCIGWIAMGHREGVQAIHGNFGGSNYEQLYVGICIVRPQKGFPLFTLIGNYPETSILEEQRAAAEGDKQGALQGQEWTSVCIMEEFQLDWSKHHK